MPTNRTRRARARKVDPEPWQVEFLRFGRVLRTDGSESPRPFLYDRQWGGCFADHWRGVWVRVKGQVHREYPNEVLWADKEQRNS